MRLRRRLPLSTGGAWVAVVVVSVEVEVRREDAEMDGRGEAMVDIVGFAFCHRASRDI